MFSPELLDENLRKTEEAKLKKFLKLMMKCMERETTVCKTI